MTYVVTIVTPEGSLRLRLRNAQSVLVEDGEPPEGMQVEYLIKGRVVGEFRLRGMVEFLRKPEAPCPDVVLGVLAPVSVRPARSRGRVEAPQIRPLYSAEVAHRE